MLKTLLVSTAFIGALVAQMPSPTPTGSASPTPMPVPTVTPAPTPTPLPTPLLLPPEAPPQILAVQVSDPVFRSGEMVSGTVVTSTNVATVEVHLAGRVAHVPRADAGIWQMSYRMPRVPFFMWGTYTAQIVARNSAGSAATREMTVSVR